MSGTPAAPGASGPAIAINPWAIAVAVSLATFMEVLDTTIVNVSLGHVAGSLAAGQDESTWVLTSYLVANGIVLPISGWLSNVFGRKRFFLGCIVAFTAASFACGAATSLTGLIICRIIQGLAGGGLQPTQQAIILDAFPPHMRAKVFAITGITLICAPVIGPTLGGFITDNYSWRWIFYINVPVGILAFMLVSRMVTDPSHAQARGWGKVDGIGLGLIALGLGSLQLMLDRGQQLDWFDDASICILAFLAVASLVGAVVWLLRQHDPVVNLRLMAQPGYGMGTVLIFFVGFVLYASNVLLPMLVTTQMGYNAELAGLVLSPGALALIVLMPLVGGKLVNVIETRYLVMTGLFLCGAGQIATSFFSPQTDYTTLVLMRTLQVLGLPFLFIPVSALAFRSIPAGENNKASALFSLFRNMGGSMGVALVTTYLMRESQMHQSYLSEHLTPLNPMMQLALDERVTAALAKGMSQAQAIAYANGNLMQELVRQAQLLAYQDAFLRLGVIMLALIPLAALLPKGKAGGPAAAAH